MPRYMNVECPVDEPDQVLGEFANAIRLTADGTDEVLLDFCVYSASQKRARVVSRVRVHRTFLLTLRDKIGDAVAPQTGEPPVLFIMPAVKGES